MYVAKLWGFCLVLLGLGAECVCVCFLKLITAGNSESTTSGIMCWPFLKDVAIRCLDRCFGSAFIQVPVSTILEGEGKFH